MLPRDARPLTDWRSRDEFFKNVAEGIRETVRRIAKKRVNNLVPMERTSLLRQGHSMPQLRMKFQSASPERSCRSFAWPIPKGCVLRFLKTRVPAAGHVGPIHVRQPMCDPNLFGLGTRFWL